MTLLIEIYYRHQLPKGDPDLIQQQARINRQAETLLSRMQSESAPVQPASPLEELHTFIARQPHLSWVRRIKTLHQKYKRNTLSKWPADTLQLLAEIFPADEPHTRFDGKSSYNLFKSIAAMMLHLETTQPA